MNTTSKTPIADAVRRVVELDITDELYKNFIDVRPDKRRGPRGLNRLAQAAHSNRVRTTDAVDFAQMWVAMGRSQYPLSRNSLTEYLAK